MEKRLDRVVNSWVQEDRMVFWASRSSKNFWTLSVFITNSVAIDGRFGGIADVLEVFTIQLGISEFKNPKTLVGRKKKECKSLRNYFLLFLRKMVTFFSYIT